MTMSRELKDGVLSKITEGENPIMKKKISAAIALVMVLLLAALAAAMALTNGFGLFSLMGRDKTEEFSTVQSDAYALLKKDVASYSFAHVDVTIKEAVYDGRYLRVVYSTRDRSAAAPFSVDFNTEQAESFTFEAANADHINWMTMDWCTVDGQHVYPLGETGTYAGEGKGEIISWEQFDLTGITLKDPFTVELPICNTVETPKELTFTMSSTNLQGVYRIQPPAAARLGDYTLTVKEMLITPIRVYLDVEISVDPGVSMERCAHIKGKWLMDGGLADEKGENRLTVSGGSAGYTGNTQWSDKDFKDHIVDPAKPVLMVVQMEFLTSSSYPAAFLLTNGEDSALIPNTAMK